MIDKSKKISFVIPCYYSEKTIRGVVNDIDSEFPDELYSKEIVLVNDGSNDNTLNELKKLSDEKEGIIVVNLAKNFGQDAASMAGYRHASGDYIVTLDDDGQNPPREAHTLLNKIEEGYDAVFGRYDVKRQSRFKNFGSRLNALMAYFLLSKPKDLELNSYFVINKFVRDEMIKYDGSYTYIWGLILRSTSNIANVTIEHLERTVGTTTYSFGKLVALWMNGFTAFSIKPLRVSSVFGVLMSVIGFIITIILSIKALLIGDVPGWTSLMGAILLLFGVQFIMIGLLGEYIGRIYINNNKAPQYVVREVYKGEK